MRLISKTAVSFAVAISGLLVFGGLSAAGSTNQIRALQSAESGSTTTLTITGTATPTFTVYKLERPSRLVVDVAGAELDPALGEDDASWRPNTWAVSHVVASARTDRKAKLVRVVVSLARSSSYRVKAQGNKLVIRVRARNARPKQHISKSDVSAARLAAEKKAERSTRLANERARQAEARAAAEVARANAISADAAQKRKAEIAKRKAAEARLAAALAETKAAKTRAAAAEREMVQARESASSAKRAADKRAAKAAREAADARKNARKASAEAATRLQAAETRIKNAAERADRANKMVAAAEKARSEAKKVAAAATQREKSASAALARAKRREAEAATAERRAARAKEQADRAKATGSSESAKLARQAQEAARAADKRRAAAEEAARVADTRRREAEKAERAALKRSKSTTAAVAAAERRRSSAEKARVAAEKARTSAESDNRALIAKIDQAKVRAKEASRRADSFVKAAALARTQAAEARASRLVEERALETAARARVKAERERQRAELAASELKASVVAHRRAQSELAARRSAAKKAATRASSSRERDNARTELAAAKQALAASKRALAASERKAKQLASSRDKASAELAERKRHAQRAQRDRKREEKLASQMQARQSSADAALRLAESRLAAAQKDRKRARSAAVAAEAARAAAEKERAAAAESRSEATTVLRAARADRRKAAADRKEAAALKAKANSTRRAAKRKAQAAKPKTPRVNDVKFVDSGNAARVVVGLSGAAKPRVIKNRGRVAILEINGVKMSKDLERTLDTSAFDGPIKAVSSYRDPKKPNTIRVVVDLYKPTKGILKRVGTTYYWDFPSGKSRTTARSATRSPTTRSQRGTRLASAASSANASTSITQQTVAQSRRGRRRVYRGRRIDLNFKDADIHNLLRILATVGGVNIVVPQTVKGTVTVRLKSVPWDQAMEVILSSQGLWYRRDGSLIRVALRETLEKEDEDAAKRRAAALKSEAPEPEIFTLNYASAEKIKAQLGGLVSPKGRVEINERTNSLIINDIAAHRRRIIDLATRLDTQTPQIQIEARIVEARTTFVREFGIQWGGNASASPQGGNPTGLVFPNSIDVAGAGDDNVTPGAGVAAAPTNFAVNLPAAIGTGAGGGLGLSLGSVGGNFNINLRLSALEDQGSARIISAPKVTVSNNIQAMIKSGVSIPISVVSANGTQTQFVPADLLLEVTPKVSQRDCSVSMDINVTKNEADFANTGARGDPSILTKEAKTTILVADGETAVIGGIYTRNTALNYSKVPFFADIPVLGYFFKNRRENDDRSEVLLFVTPKITNRAFLRCQ